MRGEIGAAALAAMMMMSALFIRGALDGTVAIPSRDNYGTHDTGNFSMVIDDDGGFSGWTSLEYPIGQDRLKSASFGIGSSSGMVDYGSRGDLTTVSPLTITSPGPYTDEEGKCSFKGEAGQDFEDMLVEQTTYLNDHIADTAGHGGRWIVVDYNMSSDSAYDTVYAIQMMDIDLGTATDDLFEFDPGTNMTVVHQGTTYIGLALYSGNMSFLHGHNAGQMSSAVFDGEDAIFAHMDAPNNETTSSTAQNWYMDQVVRIPDGTFPGHFRAAFVIVVGSSMSSLREAYDDAKAGLASHWNGSAPKDWTCGTVGASASFSGPIWPPEAIQVEATPIVDGSARSTVVLPHVIGPDRTVIFSADTADLVPTHGEVEFEVVSVDPWWFGPSGSPFSILCDNEKPTVSFGDYPAWQNKNYQVAALPDDGGGSGVFATYISANGEAFRASTIATVQTEGPDNSVEAFAVDAVGNRGDTVRISGLGLDRTAPTIGTISFAPSDVNEDTIGAVKFSAEVSDQLSGLDPGTVSFRYGLGTPSFPWAPMTKVGTRYEGSASMDWNAAQGKSLYVEVRAGDVAANLRTVSAKDFIEGYNDAPKYSMELTAEDWESDSILIEFSGSDQDGDQPAFDIRFGTDGEQWALPGDLLKRLSATRYTLAVPDTPYEGKLYVKATVTDGTDSTEVPASSVRVDKKAPALSSKVEPAEYWTRTARTLSSGATDYGSGVDLFWFEVNGIKVEGRTAQLSRDGAYRVKAYVSDSSGNEARMDLPEFGIDGTAPSITSIEVSPERILDTGGIVISWAMSDATSGIAQYEAVINDGANDVVPDEYSVHLGRTSAIFKGPSLAGGKGYEFTINVKDIAGNIGVHEGSLFVNETPEVAPLNVSIPSSVKVGSTYTVTASGSDRVLLHVIYPGRSMDWIVGPVRTEGDLHTFSLQGPYAFDRPIEAWFEYLHDGDNRTYPDPHALIQVTGGRDHDGDGLEDSWEDRYNFGTDRKDKVTLDRDGDGLDAISEMRNLTDPSFWDADGDGMDDAWESRMGTLPFVPDADGDIDMDGYTNSFERQRRTDPRDPSSVPEELAPTPWYWVLMIALFFLAVIGFFIYQILSRRKLEKELRSFDEGRWEEDA